MEALELEQLEQEVNELLRLITQLREENLELKRNLKFSRNQESRLRRTNVSAQDQIKQIINRLKEHE